MQSLLWLVASLLLSGIAQANTVKLVALTPRAQNQVDENLTSVAAEFIVDALGRSKGMHALGTADALPFLDEMGQAQLGSCDDDSTCLFEIGGALGVDYVVASSIAALSGSWVVTLRFLNLVAGTISQRATVTLPRDEPTFVKALCPFVQNALAELAVMDPRINADPNVCDGFEPSPPLPLSDGGDFEHLPDLADGGPANRFQLGFRLGFGGHAGILGASVEARYSFYSFNLGTGAYTLTSAATARMLTFDVGRGGTLYPYASAHFAWTLKEGLFGVEQRPGSAVGATVGVEYLPLPWLSLKGGAGLAYNPQTWGLEGYAPLAWDATVGFLF